MPSNYLLQHTTTTKSVLIDRQSNRFTQSISDQETEDPPPSIAMPRTRTAPAGLATPRAREEPMASSSHRYWACMPSRTLPRTQRTLIRHFQLRNDKSASFAISSSSVAETEWIRRFISDAPPHHLNNEAATNGIESTLHQQLLTRKRWIFMLPVWRGRTVSGRRVIFQLTVLHH